MADVDYKVIWSEGAQLDFREILEYIANDNPDAAIRVGEMIMSRINQLINFPQMGSRIPEEQMLEMRQVVAGNYPVIYRVAEERGVIGIVRIWNGVRGEFEI